ncbi:MAG: quinate 5-dehydrogenase [Candidatus Aminicenantes bacterium]|nr:quinate 5-dehydrogenase [Candidatus Aminicenantes bacterium]
MRRAVSVSLGSSRRDHAVDVEIGGIPVRLERIGTDGDFKKAARLFLELDGKVDALGLGGADLGFRIKGRSYPIRSIRRIVREIRKTPLVDGSGLKGAIESRTAAFLEERLGARLGEKRVLMTSAIDRWEMAGSFAQAGYDCVFGDLMFSMGFPGPVRSLRTAGRLASVILPVITRLPFRWFYPTGHQQEERNPKWGKWFRWARIIAGDCLYILRALPEKLEGRIVVTNTTTPEDVGRFRDAGIKYLITTTPVLQGRTFGTNLMEAGLIAAVGSGRTMSADEIRVEVDRLGWTPEIRELN